MNIYQKKSDSIPQGLCQPAGNNSTVIKDNRSKTIQQKNRLSSAVPKQKEGLSKSAENAAKGMHKEAGPIVQRMPLEKFQATAKHELNENYGQFLVYFKNDYEAHERMGAFYTGERMYRSWTEYVQDPAFNEKMLNMYIDNFNGIGSLPPLAPVGEFSPEIEEDTGPKKPWQKTAAKKEPKVTGTVPTKSSVNWAFFEHQPLFPRTLGSFDKPIEDQVHELDIVQGSLGDCWLLATIGAIAIKSPEDLIELIKEVHLTGFPTPKRIFKVSLHTEIGRTPVDVLVDSSLPVNKGNLIYGGKGKGAHDYFSLYLPLIEKAIAGNIGNSVGYQSITSWGARKGFGLLTGKLPHEIQITTLAGDPDLQHFVAQNKDKAMTISGMRKNPPSGPDKETNFEPHDMVVLDTNGVRFTIYDQSARTGHRIVHTTLTDMVHEVVAGPYVYLFNKLNIAQTGTRSYGEGADLLKKFHIHSELYLLQRMQVIPDIIGLFKKLHEIENRLNVLEATMELDFAVIEEKLNRLKALLSSFH